MSQPLRYRMAIVLLSLVAALVALYLHLWKLGLVGVLTCTSAGGCEIAMMAGAVLGAASMRRVALVDGFISTAAALSAAPPTASTGRRTR